MMESISGEVGIEGFGPFPNLAIRSFSWPEKICAVTGFSVESSLYWSANPIKWPASCAYRFLLVSERGSDHVPPKLYPALGGMIDATNDRKFLSRMRVM